MELIKAITKTVSNAVDYTVRKTGEMSDIARLKLRRAKVAEEVNEAYARIGQLVYRDYRDECDHSEEIAALCEAIQEGHAEMKRIAESIEGIKLLAKMETEQVPAEEEDDEPIEEFFDSDDITF